MFDIDLTRERGRARLSLAGTLDSHDDCDLLTEAFSFVQPTDDLMLDLTDVDVLDRGAAVWLHSSIQCRSSTAEAVSVAGDLFTAVVDDGELSLAEDAAGDDARRRTAKARTVAEVEMDGVAIDLVSVGAQRCRERIRLRADTDVVDRSRQVRQ